jgi:hypothetical protein
MKRHFVIMLTVALIVITFPISVGADSKNLAASTPVGTKVLFSVSKKLSLGNCGPNASIDAMNVGFPTLTI